MKRFIFITFFIIMAAVTARTAVFAATAEDMRELVGEGRLSSSDRQEELSKIIWEYSELLLKQDVASSLNLSVEEFISSQKEIKEKEQSAVLTFTESFKNGKSAEEVLNLYADAKSATREYEKFRGIASDAEWSGDYDIKDAYERAMILSERINELYDIGEIGDKMLTPSNSGSVRIKYPFGSYYGEDGRLTESDFITLFMSEPAEQVKKRGTVVNDAVVSVLNGKVSSVTERNGQYDISVRSGDSITVIYSGLSEVYVSEEEPVNQYELIGASHEYITYSVYLDEKPINPLYILGGKGRVAYERFYRENPGVIAEYDDFKNVLNTIDYEFFGPKVTVTPEDRSYVIDENGNKSTLTIEGSGTAPEPVVLP